MSVIKIVELIGSSNLNWQDAVEKAIKRTAKTVRNIHGVDVIKWTGKVQGDKIVEYTAKVKISFIVEEVSG
jgi:flavin-binding protein dodecin